MFTRGLAASGLALLLFMHTARAQDIGARDTLKHGCHAVIFYEHNDIDTFSFPIYVFSDDSLEIISIVICYVGQSVNFLSADIGQTVFDAPGSSFVVTSKPEQSAFALTWISSPEAPLSPLIESEIFARLFFTSVGCPDDLEIDTCWLPTVGSTEFVPSGGDSYTPRCFEGWFGTQCGMVACVAVDDENDPANVADQQCTAKSFPNPFNSGTTIEVDLPSFQHLSIVIYDILGRHVLTIADDFVTRGPHQFAWDGNNESGKPAASGVYFARITIGSDHVVRKLVLLR